jgi:hypothetical protein
MKVLLDAYRYVMLQLNAVNRTTTVEDMEATFAAFCEAQREDEDLRPQWVRELLHEAGEFDAERFNDAFVAGSSSDAPAPTNGDDVQGYGPLMATSEYAATTGRVEPLRYSEVVEPFECEHPNNVSDERANDDAAASKTTVHAFSRKVVVYAQPQPGGWGSKRSPFCGMDYMDAFNTTPEPLAAAPDESEPLEVLLERLQEERTALQGCEASARFNAFNDDHEVPPLLIEVQ